MQIFKYITYLLLITLTTAIYANNQNYSAQVPVADRSQKEWRQGIQTALKQALIAVTNNQDIANAPAVKKILPKAEDLIQSYSYQTIKKDNQNQLMLEVNFDNKSIQAVINDLGQKISPPKSQELLTWLVVRDSNDEKFISSDSQNNNATALQNAAQQNQLTLTLPMGDLTDLNALSTNDVATLEPDPIIQASTRYQTQNIIAGYVAPTIDGQSWQADWWLLYNGKNTQFQTIGNNAAQAIANGINKVANNLANSTINMTVKPNYTSSTPNAIVNEQLLLKITGVNGLGDYAEAMKYLRSLLGVTQVDIDNVQGQDIILRITTTDQNIVLTQLSQSQKLIANPTSTDHPSLMTYRWATPINLESKINANEPTNTSMRNINSQEGISP